MSVKIDYQTTSPRFSVANIDEFQKGIEYFNRHGYAVFSEILNPKEINTSIDLFWQFLENLKQPYTIRRNDLISWQTNWPGTEDIGLINTDGIGQSEFLWSIRGNRNVKKVFAKLWNSNELFTSFDGAGCFRNWSINPQWKTESGWYHCDQNPFKKPDRCSIQGLVSLTTNDESTGGLVLVPNSQEIFSELEYFVDESHVWGDFISIPSNFMNSLQPCLIKCQAGDLIVWDSRCIHCNTPAIIRPSIEQNAILRLVAYICMSPIELFKPDGVRFENLEEFRELREDFVRQRITCSHWPLELLSTNYRVSRDDIVPMKLNAYQYSLIIGTDMKEEEEKNQEILF